METIIIDAYNLMHKVRELQVLLKQTQDVAVDTMIAKFQAHFFGTKTKIIIVFDGYGLNKQSGNIIVKFAKTDIGHPYENADQLIKATVDKTRNKKLIKVVSSDNSITLYARDSGCRIQSSASFWSELNEKRTRRNIQQSESSEKPSVVTRSEIEYLLKQFTRKNGGN
jgi:predicted RNA-binding protein with PIN domain